MLQIYPSTIMFHLTIKLKGLRWKITLKSLNFSKFQESQSIFDHFSFVKARVINKPWCYRFIEILPFLVFIDNTSA